MENLEQNNDFILWQNYDLDEYDFCETWEEKVDENNFEYELFVDNFDKAMLKAPTCHFLVVGSFGRWTGNFDGGDVINIGTWRDLLDTNVFKDCDYFKFYEPQNGTLTLQASHHDGTHSLQLYALNEAGRELYYSWLDNYDDPTTERELHEKLLHKDFSQPFLVSTVF